MKTVKIFSSILTVIALTSCSFLNTKKFDHEYDHETDETAIQRVGDWGFDLPGNTTVINRYIFEWPGWDGGFDGFYYVFKVNDNYSLNEVKVIDNEPLKTRWEQLNDSDCLEPEINRPNFESDMSCYIVIRWTNKFVYGTNREGKEYKNEFVESDQNYLRQEHIGDWGYAGKGYFILQSRGPNETYLYSSLTIDTAEEIVTPIDN